MNLIKLTTTAALILFSISAFATPVFLDVRTDEEYANSHIEGAKHISIESPSFKDEVSKLDKNATYQVYCKRGGRAERAAKTMKELGFKNIESTGGIKDIASKAGAKCQGKTTRCE